MIAWNDQSQVLLHEVNFNTLRQGATCTIWKVTGTTSAGIASYTDPYNQVPHIVPMTFDILADAFYVLLSAPYPGSQEDVTVLYR